MSKSPFSALPWDPRPKFLAGIVLFLSAIGAGAAPFGARPDSPGAPVPAPAAPAPLPRLLSQTGLYVAGSTTDVDAGNLPYVPQYPLWSDGAAKRRWIRLPANTRIDAVNADAWEFPAGTRFWKEFSYDGERTETRFMERLPDGSFRYATYVWDAALKDAVLAPDGGVRGVHDVPSLDDCRTCHGNRTSPVLGFNALQLSPDRDPRAPHREAPLPGAVDLPELARRGLVSGLQPSLLSTPPRIAAPSPTARAAAGYLFANCSGCHAAEGPLAVVGLRFEQSVTDAGGYERMVQSIAGQPSRFAIPSQTTTLRVAPGRPRASAVWFRMHSRNPAERMPPLGTKLVDTEGLALVEQWISEDLRH